jgi:hypothetical protein
MNPDMSVFGAEKHTRILFHQSLGVGSAEQVAQRLPPKQGSPTPPLMLGSVVDHVASLAEGREVGVRVVRGVVIPMGGSQNDPGATGTAEDVSFRSDPDPAAPAIPPPAGIRVPPAAVTEVVDHPPVRSPAALTASLRPAEPNDG